MSKVILMYDTEVKTLRTLVDGEVVAEPEFITFDRRFDQDGSDQVKYHMRVLHIEPENNGMRVETTVTAAKHYPECDGLDGDAKKECNKKAKAKTKR